jgi:hypothetical protein
MFFYLSKLYDTFKFSKSMLHIWFLKRTLKQQRTIYSWILSVLNMQNNFKNFINNFASNFHHWNFHNNGAYWNNNNNSNNNKIQIIVFICSKIQKYNFKHYIHPVVIHMTMMTPHSPPMHSPPQKISSLYTTYHTIITSKLYDNLWISSCVHDFHRAMMFSLTNLGSNLNVSRAI